jgi:hypothetical protein
VLKPVAERKVYSLVQLIYRSKHYEGGSKDYEFSRTSMREHWRAGYDDTARALRHPEVLQRPASIEGVPCLTSLRMGGSDPSSATMLGVMLLRTSRITAALHASTN